MTAGHERTAQPTAPDWYRQSEALLAQQESLLARLDALSRRQGDLIETGEAEALLAVLTERQPIVEELAATTRSLAEARTRWDMGPAGEPRRSELSERMRRSADMAASIAARDQEDELAMRRASDSIASELGSLGRQRTAAAAYATPAAVSRARLQDREG